MINVLRSASGLIVATTLLTSGWFLAPATAADFPTGPVTLIVHTSAGGPLDTLARRTGEMLERQLGWSTRVENRQGASGVVAASRLMLQPADGHTLLFVTKALPNNFALGSMHNDLDEFAFLAIVQGEPSAMAVRADSPLATVDDYVEAMRADPDALRVAGSGRGGNDFVHFLLNQEAGLASTWVPFDSAPEVVAALVGGHVDVAFMTPSSALAQIRSGDVRLLAVSSPERSPDYPDVPTLLESGYAVDDILWRGIVTKAGTPDATIDAIIDAIAQLRETEEWRQMLEQQNQESIWITGDNFRARVEREISELRHYYVESGLVD